MLAKQVENSHYWKETYLCKERFLHYREQFITLLKLSPSSILEIGPGPGLLSIMLRRICEKVITVDFADDLKPDIVADIKNIPIENAMFDVVCSFQVLEHIPWEEVPYALLEMARLSKEYVLFSVPDNNEMKKLVFSFKFSLLSRSIGYIMEKKRYKGVSNKKEHYWEIGVNSATNASLTKIINNSGLTLVNNWLDGVDRYFLCKIATT
jgi:ubiquinone/menaquinone biosynthesis C-methylase UbiE